MYVFFGVSSLQWTLSKELLLRLQTAVHIKLKFSFILFTSNYNSPSTSMLPSSVGLQETRDVEQLFHERT